MNLLWVLVLVFAIPIALAGGLWWALVTLLKPHPPYKASFNRVSKKWNLWQHTGSCYWPLTDEAFPTQEAAKAWLRNWVEAEQEDVCFDDKGREVKA